MTILEMLLAFEVNEIIGLMEAPAFLNLFNVEIILRTLNNTIETHAKMKETIFKTSPGMEASIESHVTWPHRGSADRHFSLRIKILCFILNFFRDSMDKNYASENVE